MEYLQGCEGVKLAFPLNGQSDRHFRPSPRCRLDRQLGPNCFSLLTHAPQTAMLGPILLDLCRIAALALVADGDTAMIPVYIESHYRGGHSGMLVKVGQCLLDDTELDFWRQVLIWPQR
jgi:hypothetical protein